jgi:hypothetical protein
LLLTLYNTILYDDTPDLDIIRMLLSSGADPNSIWQIKAYGRETYIAFALRIAINQKDSRKIQLLLEARASANREPMNQLQLPLTLLAISKTDPDIIRRNPFY